MPLAHRSPPGACPRRLCLCRPPRGDVHVQRPSQPVRLTIAVGAHQPGSCFCSSSVSHRRCTSASASPPRSPAALAAESPSAVWLPSPGQTGRRWPAQPARLRGRQGLSLRLRAHRLDAVVCLLEHSVPQQLHAAHEDDVQPAALDEPHRARVLHNCCLGETQDRTWAQCDAGGSTAPRRTQTWAG